MNIKPLGERVLIKVKKKEEKTTHGLYLPESAQEEKKQGTVVAVGATKEGKELPLKAGDIILYGGYSSEEFEFNGEKFLLIEFKDILATLE